MLGQSQHWNRQQLLTPTQSYFRKQSLSNTKCSNLDQYQDSSQTCPKKISLPAFKISIFASAPSSCLKESVCIQSRLEEDNEEKTVKNWLNKLGVRVSQIEVSPLCRGVAQTLPSWPTGTARPPDRTERPMLAWCWAGGAEARHRTGGQFILAEQVGTPWALRVGKAVGRRGPTSASRTLALQPGTVGTVGAAPSRLGTGRWVTSPGSGTWVGCMVLRCSRCSDSEVYLFPENIMRGKGECQWKKSSGVS